jgi:hypothetical protein
MLMMDEDEQQIFGAIDIEIEQPVNEEHDNEGHVTTEDLAEDDEDYPYPDQEQLDDDEEYGDEYREDPDIIDINERHLEDDDDDGE